MSQLQTGPCGSAPALTGPDSPGGFSTIGSQGSLCFSHPHRCPPGSDSCYSHFIDEGKGAREAQLFHQDLRAGK